MSRSSWRWWVALPTAFLVGSLSALFDIVGGMLISVGEAFQWCDQALMRRIDGLGRWAHRSGRPDSTQKLTARRS